MTNYSSNMTRPADPVSALRHALNAALRAADVSWAELSARTGLSTSLLRRDLAGKGGFRVSTFLAVASALGVESYGFLEEAGLT